MKGSDESTPHCWPELIFDSSIIDELEFELDYEAVFESEVSVVLLQSLVMRRRPGPGRRRARQKLTLRRKVRRELFS